jgi:hypothetical protein
MKETTIICLYTLITGESVSGKKLEWTSSEQGS